MSLACGLLHTCKGALFFDHGEDAFSDSDAYARIHSGLPKQNPATDPAHSLASQTASQRWTELGELCSVKEGGGTADRSTCLESLDRDLLV